MNGQKSHAKSSERASAVHRNPTASSAHFASSASHTHHHHSHHQSAGRNSSSMPPNARHQHLNSAVGPAQVGVPRNSHRQKSAEEANSKSNTPRATMENIGKSFNIYSKAKIRYQGVMSSIDPVNYTLTLANVQCFGTEGRESCPEEFFPEKSQIYATVVFYAYDIDHLDQIDNDDKEMLMADSAVLHFTVADDTGSKGQNKNENGQSKTQPKNSKSTIKSVKAESSGAKNAKPKGKRFQSYHNKRQFGGQIKVDPKAADELKKNLTMDLDAASVIKELDIEEGKENQIKPIYNKDDCFFDNVDSTKIPSGRQSLSEQKKDNMETFGKQFKAQQRQLYSYRRGRRNFHNHRKNSNQSSSAAPKEKPQVDNLAEITNKISDVKVTHSPAPVAESAA